MRTEKEIRNKLKEIQNTNKKEQTEMRALIIVTLLWVLGNEEKTDTNNISEK